MRRTLALLAATLAIPAATAAAQDAPPTHLCTARFASGDTLPFEHRLVGFLTGDGCAPGDLLHFVFGAEGMAAAVAARHCRFDLPVLVDRGPETHLVCVWRGTMRSVGPD